MAPIKIADTDKEKIIVTLAMIQNALDEQVKRTADHHKALFGNGTPENSIVWSIKELSQTIKDLQEEIKINHEKESKELEALAISNLETKKAVEKIQKDLESYKNNDENLSWKQWFKKISMKWLPIIALIILAIIAFREPFTAIIVGLVKLFG